MNTASVELSLVLACYNAAAHLEKNLRKIQSTLDAAGLSYELILVDDQSSDATAQIARHYAEENPGVFFYQNAINQGRGAAVSRGIAAARGEIAGYLDLDLDISPEAVLLMTSEIQKDGADIASARRIHQTPGTVYHWLRRFLSRCYARLSSLLLQTGLKDTEAGCKFFRREKATALLRDTQNKKWFWDTEIMTRAFYAGLKISEIPVPFIQSRASTVAIFSDSFDYLRDLWNFLPAKRQLRKKAGDPLIYRSPWVYSRIMRFLYGGHFESRYLKVAEQIPENAEVLDLCCGDCRIYERYLKQKGVDYLGVDLSRNFSREAEKKGIPFRVMDIAREEIPEADYILIMGSAYQFFNQREAFLLKLLKKAGKKLIITEPVMNLAQSKNRLAAFLAKAVTQQERFDRESFPEWISPYRDRVELVETLAGGREILAVLNTEESCLRNQSANFPSIQG